MSNLLGMTGFDWLLIRNAMQAGVGRLAPLSNRPNKTATFDVSFDRNASFAYAKVA